MFPFRWGPVGGSFGQFWCYEIAFSSGLCLIVAELLANPQDCSGHQPQKKMTDDDDACAILIITVPTRQSSSWSPQSERSRPVRAANRRPQSLLATAAERHCSSHCDACS
jgi:hypothetical protein